MSLTGDDLEQIKSLVVEPLQQRFDDLHKSISEQNAARDNVLGNHSDRLNALEGNQRKALLGFFGMAAAIQIGWNLAWAKVKTWLGWK